MKIAGKIKQRSETLLEFRLERYLSVAYILLFAVAIAAASAQGWFRPLTGALFDPMIRYAPARAFPESELIGIELEHRQIGDTDYAKLLQRLAELDARAVAFNFSPPTRALKQIGDAGVAVVFGQPPRFDAVTGDFALPLASPDAPVQMPFGLSMAPPSEFGVNRRALLRRRIDGVAVRTFEAAVLDAVHVDYQAFGDEEILVNFLDGGNRVPTIGLDRVLGKRVPRSLIAGRIVVVGHVQGDAEPGLRTPATGNARTTSLLRFQLQALDTLLRGDRLREMGFAGQAALYLAIVLMALFLYQTRPVRASIILTAALITGFIALAWALLFWFRLTLPVIEMTTVLLFAFFVVSVDRIIKGELLLHQALIESSSKTRDRIIPSSFFATEDPWIYVANLLSQTLELRRMIFLEKIEGDHRVHEVHALNCSLDSIDERRRDYQRTPYSTAITLQAPVLLQKNYLKDDDSGEQQYLVCLSFGGEIIGFWAFGVMPQAIPDSGNFTGLVQDFADQVAEMLYHRQRWLRDQVISKLRLRQYFQLSLWADRVTAFRESQTLLDRRMNTLEVVFDGSGTAALLYDLFGRVVHVNRRMEELLKHADLPLYSMSSVELVTALTGKDAAAARQYLYYVVVERAVISLPAPRLTLGRRDYLLHLRPLERSVLEIGGEDQADAQGLRLGGVLIEVQDITMFKTLNDLQENLVNRLDLRLRNDLESVLLAVDLLPDDGGDNAMSLKRILADKTGAMVGSFEEIQQELNFTLDIQEIERYPIAYRSLLERAVVELRDEAARNKVTVVCEVPDMSPLVIASPEGLTEVFKAFLNLLIEDAVEDSEMRIVVHTEANAVRFEFSNAGFGIPVARLNDYLYGHIDTSIDEFRRVRSAVRRVDSWRGVVVANSEIGRGITIDLTLKGFM